MPLTFTPTVRFATGRHPVAVAFALASLLVSAFIVLKVGWPFAKPRELPESNDGSAAHNTETGSEQGKGQERQKKKE